MDPGVTAAWQSAARVFESLGVQVIPTRLPDWYFELAAATGRKAGPLADRVLAAGNRVPVDADRVPARLSAGRSQRGCSGPPFAGILLGAQQRFGRSSSDIRLHVSLGSP